MAYFNALTCTWIRASNTEYRPECHRYQYWYCTVQYSSFRHQQF